MGPVAKKLDQQIVPAVTQSMQTAMSHSVCPHVARGGETFSTSVRLTDGYAGELYLKCPSQLALFGLRNTLDSKGRVNRKHKRGRTFSW